MSAALCRLALATSLAGSLALSLPRAAAADEVVVFAAASLKTALDQVAAEFTRETGHEVTVSYAGSGALAKQIIEGAPADIFLSAAENWMDEVEKAGLIAGESRRDLWGNSLVLIAHGEKTAPVALSPETDLPALLEGGKLAMALVDSVPAGQYGKAALEHLGLWEGLAPSVAQADNVRAALSLVSLGEAPYGIVYATDAGAGTRAGDAISIAGEFPPESHPPITYPAALLSGAADPADQAFFDALSAPAAGKIFASEGFTLLN